MIKPWDERNDTTVSAESNVDDQVRCQPSIVPLSVDNASDLQMIIHVPFTQNVRVRSILLKLGKQ